MSVNAGRRGEFAQGLLLLGELGIMLSLIFLGLDFSAFDDRSNTQVALLSAGILGVAAGGWLARSPRAAATALLAAVFLAALFLFATAFLAWLQSGYFFPARSRLLLRAALLALLLCGGGLAAAAWRRRRGGGARRP